MTLVTIDYSKTVFVCIIEREETHTSRSSQIHGRSVFVSSCSHKFQNRKKKSYVRKMLCKNDMFISQETTLNM